MLVQWRRISRLAGRQQTTCPVHAPFSLLRTHSFLLPFAERPLNVCCLLFFFLHTRNYHPILPPPTSTPTHPLTEKRVGDITCPCLPSCAMDRLIAGYRRVRRVSKGTGMQYVCFLIQGHNICMLPASPAAVGCQDRPMRVSIHRITGASLSSWWGLVRDEQEKKQMTWLSSAHKERSGWWRADVRVSAGMHYGGSPAV